MYYKQHLKLHHVTLHHSMYPTQHLTLTDILKAPGADLLSDKELLLCSEVPMLPMHYLTAKDAVVR